jgi:predicted RNA-binding Zn ribbon-like protein
MSDDADFAPVETMDLRGGDVGLDFVNTASGRDSGVLREKLRVYDDLVTWAERVELTTPARGRRLRASARTSADEARAVLERAHALREAMYRILGTDDPDAGDLRLVAGREAYVFAWPESDRLEQLIWPVALSAAELLTSEDRPRVKECAADDCNWLFLDMSRNRSRRWCDMKVCGNRAKARRFSERHKTG